MILKDLISILLLVLGLIGSVIVFVLAKHQRVRPEKWPPFLAIGGASYTFIALMAFSLFLQPGSEFASYTLINSLWALGIGFLCYFGGRYIIRAASSKDR